MAFIIGNKATKVETEFGPITIKTPGLNVEIETDLSKHVPRMDVVGGGESKALTKI